MPLYKGKERTVTDLARLAWTSRETMRSRLKRMTPEDAVNFGTMRAKTAKPQYKMIEYNGKEYTIKQLADKRGVALSTMRRRLAEMADIDEAMGPEPTPNNNYVKPQSATGGNAEWHAISAGSRYNRATHCFRPDKTRNIRCGRYTECLFDKCKGYVPEPDTPETISISGIANIIGTLR